MIITALVDREVVTRKWDEVGIWRLKISISGSASWYSGVKFYGCTAGVLSTLLALVIEHAWVSVVTGTWMMDNVQSLKSVVFADKDVFLDLVAV